MAKAKPTKWRPLPDKPIKTRKCVFCSKKGQNIDYKDTSLLRTYISERGKIRARRVTGPGQQLRRRAFPGTCRGIFCGRGTSIVGGDAVRTWNQAQARLAAATAPAAAVRRGTAPPGSSAPPATIPTGPADAPGPEGPKPNSP